MGWLSNAGWFLINCACVLYPAQLTMALVQGTHPTYEAKSWHTYLVYVTFALVFLVLNLPRIFKVMGWIMTSVCVAINFTALYLFIALLVRTHPKQTASFVFTQYDNISGWSDGTAFFVALLPGFACLAAFDNATHLTDELENPKKQVPQVIIGSFVMSFLTTIPMILVYEFCNIDPESLLTPVGGQPLMQLMQNAFRNDAMVIFGMVMIIACISVAGLSCLVSWSRLYWSFSREGAMPFSNAMSKLSSRDALPLNALLLNTGLTLAMGVINIGSHTAMNALLGGANLCLLSAILPAMGLALYRGRSTFPQDRWLNLGGRVGDAIFLFAMLWSIFVCIMLCFPLYVPVTASYMNWSSVVFGGVLVISGLYWVVFFRTGKGARQMEHAAEAAQAEEEK
jgi:amino acid transporter